MVARYVICRCRVFVLGICKCSRVINVYDIIVYLQLDIEHSI